MLDFLIVFLQYGISDFKGRNKVKKILGAISAISFIYMVSATGTAVALSRADFTYNSLRCSSSYKTFLKGLLQEDAYHPNCVKSGLKKLQDPGSELSLLLKNEPELRDVLIKYIDLYLSDISLPASHNVHIQQIREILRKVFLGMGDIQAGLMHWNRNKNNYLKQIRNEQHPSFLTVSQLLQGAAALYQEAKSQNSSLSIEAAQKIKEAYEMFADLMENEKRDGSNVKKIAEMTNINRHFKAIQLLNGQRAVQPLNDLSQQVAILDSIQPVRMKQVDGRHSVLDRLQPLDETEASRMQQTESKIKHRTLPAALPPLDAVDQNQIKENAHLQQMASAKVRINDSVGARPMVAATSKIRENVGEQKSDGVLAGDNQQVPKVVNSVQNRRSLPPPVPPRKKPLPQRPMSIA
jgi:hypothetical protein